jgi:hypothetical protein
LFNTPGVDKGWGLAEPGLEYLDRVARTSLAGSVNIEYNQKGITTEASFEALPVYYLEHSWSNIKAKEETFRSIDEFKARLSKGFLGILETLDTTGKIDSLLASISPDTPLADIRTQYDKGRWYASEATTPTSDGFIDGDGVVALDSGLGLFLSTTTPEYFSHERTWDVAGETLRGSWYRLFDSRYPRDETGNFPWEWANHSFAQYNPEVATWLEQNILSQAGPYVAKSPYSIWQK